nr:PLDc N-terminal domain-containing protein [Stenotrophomonas maltophilia]
MHASRSGQSLYWLILLFSFPLLGSIVYFLAIYFSEATRAARVRPSVPPSSSWTRARTFATPVPNWRARPPCRIRFGWA